MYDVVVVADTELPNEHDWVFVKVGDRLRFCVKESALHPTAFAEGWAAARMLRRLGDDRPPPRLRCVS